MQGARAVSGCCQEATGGGARTWAWAAAHHAGPIGPHTPMPLPHSPPASPPTPHLERPGGGGPGQQARGQQAHQAIVLHVGGQGCGSRGRGGRKIQVRQERRGGECSTLVGKAVSSRGEGRMARALGVSRAAGAKLGRSSRYMGCRSDEVGWDASSALQFPHPRAYPRPGPPSPVPPSMKRAASRGWNSRGMARPARAVQRMGLAAVDCVECDPSSPRGCAGRARPKQAARLTPLPSRH